jgi:hypothetical protein
MSATYVKFSSFASDVLGGQHKLSTDSVYIYLSNTSPTMSMQSYGALTEITAASGYTAGGAAILNGVTQTSGVATMTGSDVSWTANAPLGPFRYAVMYNNSATTKGLIAFWDYGAAISLNTGETFKVDLGATSVLTLA